MKIVILSAYSYLICTISYIIFVIITCLIIFCCLCVSFVIRFCDISYMKLHFYYFHYLRFEILVLLGARVIIFFFVKEYLYILELISVTCLIYPVSLLSILGYLSVLEECMFNMQIHFFASLFYLFFWSCVQWLINDRQMYVYLECCLLHFFY